MKTEELWASVKDYTRDVTEHSRKLGFAGVAICWFFKRNDFTFPAPIYPALFFFVAYFLADILQQFCGALIRKFFVEYQEYRLSKETGKHFGEVKQPRWLDWPAFALFILKVILLIIGFIFVGLYLMAMWVRSHSE